MIKNSKLFLPFFQKIKYIIYLSFFFYCEEKLSQQYLVDDAFIVTNRTLQIDAFLSENVNWFIPVYQFVPNLEISMGIGSIVNDEHLKESELLFQSKYYFNKSFVKSLNISFTTGTIFNFNRNVKDRLKLLYAYIPVSHSINSEKITLHYNLGYQQNFSDSGIAKHSVINGIRMEVLFWGSMFMWSEVAGYNFKEYEIQTALNYLFIPNSLSATISILSKIKS